MSNYATKADLKNVTGTDTSKLLAKSDLANLKAEADRLDFDKLVPVSVDLSKLSDAVKNDFIKKDVYNAKIKDIEDIIPDITNLATNTTLKAKMKLSYYLVLLT